MKDLYTSPKIKVEELVRYDVLCDSPVTRKNYNIEKKFGAMFTDVDLFDDL